MKVRREFETGLMAFCGFIFKGWQMGFELRRWWQARCTMVHCWYCFSACFTYTMLWVVYKIRVIMIQMSIPGYFLDRCKNWTRGLCDHSSDILRALQNLNDISGLDFYRTLRSTNPMSGQKLRRSHKWELTDALSHWIERECTRIGHWIYFRYLKNRFDNWLSF